MSNWNYKREEIKMITAGDHRFEVVSAEEKTSAAGNKMIVIHVRPNGAQFLVRDQFVEGEWFNRNVTSFFDSTGIEEGNFDLVTWVGAIGAARFKNEDNSIYLKVHYYIDQKRAEKLPPWVGDAPERQTVTTIGNATDDFEEIDDEDVPF